jgi:hypothetical protein
MSHPCPGRMKINNIQPKHAPTKNMSDYERKEGAFMDEIVRCASRMRVFNPLWLPVANSNQTPLFSPYMHAF